MKEKVIELKIQDEDLISGIDSISLVSEPAIEQNWFYFKRSEEHFHIPDGEDDKYISILEPKAQKEEDLLAEGFEVDRIEYIRNPQQFSNINQAHQNPDLPSFEDNDKVRVRYKYMKDPNFGGASIIDTSRQFCKDMISRNWVWRVEDMDQLVNDMGSSALVWRGSYNCRHVWARVFYKATGDVPVNANSTKNRTRKDVEDLNVIDYPQPSTKVRHSKELFTYPLFESKEDAIDYSKLLGCEEGAHPHMIGETQLWMPCAVHPEEMDYDVSQLPIYVEECPECEKKKKKEFESYTDYPEGAVSNAKRALEWVDKHGWGDCGEDTGKQRASQLANNEPISRDTIARMASFKRHQQHKDVPYSEGCGGLMWDAWGGDAGINWAQRKLEEIDKEKMAELEDACWEGYEPIGTKILDGREVPNCVPIKNSKYGKLKFEIESEDQRIVTGPCMLPDMMIPRRDENGELYHVFFTKETIRQIMMKYMKNQYTRNNDIEHDEVAVKDVYVFESWIKETEEDKSNKYGYGDLPIGTWFVSMKVDKTPAGDKVWEAVKNGSLQGFSVAGLFSEYEVQMREEEFLKELADLLKKY